MLSCYVTLTKTVQKPLTDINPTKGWCCFSVSQSKCVTGYKEVFFINCNLGIYISVHRVSLGFWSVSKTRQVLGPNTTAVSSLVCDRNGPEDSVEPCLWVHIPRLFGLSGSHMADSQISLRRTSKTLIPVVTTPVSRTHQSHWTIGGLTFWTDLCSDAPSRENSGEKTRILSSSSVLVLVLIGIDSHPAQHRPTSSTCNTSHPFCLLYSAHLQQS